MLLASFTTPLTPKDNPFFNDFPIDFRVPFATPLILALLKASPDSLRIDFLSTKSNLPNNLSPSLVNSFAVPDAVIH